jgi:hypothetical protein
MAEKDEFCGLSFSAYRAENIIRLNLLQMA